MKEAAMITRNNGEGLLCVMKLEHYLRYYEQRHGTRPSPEMVDKEAANEGFVLDRSGESGGPSNSHNTKKAVAA